MLDNCSTGDINFLELNNKNKNNKRKTQIVDDIVAILLNSNNHQNLTVVRRVLNSDELIKNNYVSSIETIDLMSSSVTDFSASPENSDCVEIIDINVDNQHNLEKTTPNENQCFLYPRLSQITFKI